MAGRQVEVGRACMPCLPACLPCSAHASSRSPCRMSALLPESFLQACVCLSGVSPPSSITGLRWGRAGRQVAGAARVLGMNAAGSSPASREAGKAQGRQKV